MPDDDQVGGARVLDDLEGDGRAKEQRREPDRGEHDVDEPARSDPRCRREPGDPAAVDRLRDDVDHRGARDDREQERRHGEERERVRLGDHDLSFSRTRSLTTFGFALPAVFCMTWPTKNPRRPSLPPLYAATWPSFAARISSISGSSSEASEIDVSAR